jgi:hypothetical protein
MCHLADSPVPSALLGYRYVEASARGEVDIVKKAYITPRLITHGTVKDITLTPSGKDPRECPTDKFGYFSCPNGVS